MDSDYYDESLMLLNMDGHDWLPKDEKPSMLLGMVGLLMYAMLGLCGITVVFFVVVAVFNVIFR